MIGVARQFHSRTLRTAFRALQRNVMRSTLTTLGIVIGVAAVITMMEIGGGSSKSLQRTIATMGADNLMIQPGAASSAGIGFGAGSAMTLTNDDCEAIVRECPAVRAAAPVVRARAQVVYGNRNWVPMFIYGTTPAFLDVRSWADLAEGDPFTDQDVRNASKVCLLGQTLVRELFQDTSPIGQEVRIQNVSFRVIGVLSTKGANMMGMDQDDVVVAPWTTIRTRVVGSSVSNVNQSSHSGTSSVNTLSERYPGKVVLYPERSELQQANSPMPVRFANVDHIQVAAQSPTQTMAAEQQITQLLRERHRLRDDDVSDFNIRNMAEMVRMMSSTTALMTRLLLFVALISLLVGGVGIMNIMLVSVTERTREIGLRMAVGAKTHDILKQFLVEAIVLCLGGGAIGIALGRGASMLINTFAKWPVELSIPAIVAAVAVSVTVGVVFGYYPAWKASRLDPIEALRYE